MKCYNTEKYIMKYMDGEMTKQEAEELNQHIQECQKCKEDFLFYDDLLQLLKKCLYMKHQQILKKMLCCKYKRFQNKKFR